MLARSSFVLVLLGAAHEAAADPSAVVKAGVDVGNAYVSRGITMERAGVVSQPFVDVTVPVVTSPGLLTALEVGGAAWASVHTGPTGQPMSTMGPQHWYEADFTGRVAATFAGELVVSAAYTAFTSPNASFQTMHELWLTVAWADRGHAVGRWLGFAPAVVVAHELGGTANGTVPGTYLGITTRPSVLLVDGKQPIELAVPLELDLSLGDYYDDATGDDTIGAASVGLQLSTSLPFIPARFGAWSLSVGARAHYFGSRMAAKVDGAPSLLAVTAGTSVAF